MTPAKPQLLLVDDDQDTLQSVGPWLRGAFELLQAGPENAYERALQLWQANPGLRLALVDLKMPGPHGMPPEEVGTWLIKELKTARPGARVAAHSAIEELRERALAAGADAFIEKELPGEELKARVCGLAATVQGNGTDSPQGEAVVSEVVQREEHDRWLQERANQVYYAGQVVVLYRQEVLGSGADHLEAMSNARAQAAVRQLAFPGAAELVCVAVPESFQLPSFFISPADKV